MSGGEKQRCGGGAALARNPKIILADEPTASLDRKSGREIIELLSKDRETTGMRHPAGDHDNRILDIADRIVTLEDGLFNVVHRGDGDPTRANLLKAFAPLQRNGDLVRHLRRSPQAVPRDPGADDY